MAPKRAALILRERSVQKAARERFHHEKGCQRGATCYFCHRCPPNEIKRRKKVKLVRRGRDEDTPLAGKSEHMHQVQKPSRERPAEFGESERTTTWLVNVLYYDNAALNFFV